MSDVDVDVLAAETRRRYAQLGEIFADGILAAADEIRRLRLEVADAKSEAEAYKMLYGPAVAEAEELRVRLDKVRAIWWDPPHDEGQQMEDLMGVRWSRSGLKCELIEPAPWRSGDDY